MNLSTFQCFFQLLNQNRLQKYKDIRKIQSLLHIILILVIWPLLQSLALEQKKETSKHKKQPSRCSSHATKEQNSQAWFVFSFQWLSVIHWWSHSGCLKSPSRPPCARSWQYHAKISYCTVCYNKVLQQ